ncbi:MAG: hypothetical protein J6T15_03425 [Bacilli bacterium]|nr:hypothetical protein [Bacilli bacterium]
MKPKRILLPLVFAALSLSGCDWGENNGSIIITDPNYNPNINEPSVDTISKTTEERENFLDSYQPEILRGFDNISQFAFNAYLARQYSISMNRTYEIDESYVPDSKDYTFDIDEDGDGGRDFIGYQISDNSSYTFEDFIYFDFYADDRFVQEKVGAGRIQALIVRDHFFGEIMLIIKNGDNYFACSEIARDSDTSTFGAYKHYNHFFMCKDTKVNYRIEVTYEGSFDEHTSIKKIQFYENVYEIVPYSVNVYGGSITVTPQEVLDYIHEVRPNTSMPIQFTRYRLPEYTGNGFTYTVDENPKGQDPDCSDMFRIDSSVYIDISDYMGLVMNSGFTYFSYGDEICFTRPYDRNYDLYLFAWYDPYVVKIRAYLVPYMNLKSANVSNEMPAEVNGLPILVSYNTQSGKFYFKSFKDYDCVFVSDSNQSEFSTFYSNLTKSGMLPDGELSKHLKVETDYGTYIINMNCLEVVPYYYIIVQRVN